MKSYFRTIPIIFLIGMFNNIEAQNSVVNGSFEDFINCPDAPSQIQRASEWDVVPNTGMGSPDYLNSCALSTSHVDVPASLFGNQLAYEGNAYMGIGVYSPTVVNAREYAQTELNAPLEAGQNYTVSFMVSRAEISGYAINNLGVVLGVDALDGDGTNTYIDIASSIHTSDVIVDTNDWVQVSGNYLASGGEKFLAIGNFFSDQNTTVLTAGDSPIAYYFIDSVSVVPNTLNLDDTKFQGFSVAPNPFTDEII